MARPTKLTPEVTDRILAALRAGNYRTPAARSAGISPATFHRWMNKGEKATRGIHRELYERVLRAEADSEVHAVATVRKAMPENWRSAVEFLERRFPDRWRRRQSIEHDGEQRIVVKAEDLADPEMRKELREIARRIAGARETGSDGPGDAG